MVASSAPSNDSVIWTGEVEKGLFESISELSEKDQYLIYYKFFEELSNKQIAKITGYSETNIGTKLHRIRKKLHSSLSNKSLT